MDGSRLTRGQAAVLIGTGGYAIELAGLLAQAGIEVAGCIGPGTPSASGLRHLGSDEVTVDWIHLPMLVAIGDPGVRRSVSRRIEAAGGKLGCFVHPMSYLDRAVPLGAGSVVYPNATIHAGVSIGDGVVVNSNATIGHETAVRDFVTLGPGCRIGGKVVIGTAAYIGIGATTIQGIRVGDGVIIGAGAVLIEDCPAPGTYVGVPARRIHA